MKKIIITTIITTITTNIAHAQNTENNIDINLYLRTSIENQQNQTTLKTNEARLEIMGSINPQLEYRIRYRTNRNTPAGTINNATSALDHAYIKYKFGQDQKWSTTIGKQINHYGSWEFYDNPTFEYQYSDYVNRQQNLFPVAAMLSYQHNEKHSFHAQAYNTHTETLEKILETKNYPGINIQKSKTPIGINLAWKGNIINDKLKTFYSFTTSQIIKNKYDIKIALANKIEINKWSGYLDLQHSYNNIDHFTVISPEINTYLQTTNTNHINDIARKLQFQSIALRINYAITPKWHITGKTVLERITSKDKDTNLKSENINQRNLNLIGLEYKPFQDQDFKIFGYYANHNNTYTQLFKNTPNTHTHMFAIGVLWFLNAL